MKPLRLFLLLILSTAAVSMGVGPAFAQNFGGEIYFSKPVKSVLFSHKFHVEETGLSCDMCHEKLFKMQALSAQQQPDFNMKSLYAGKYCGACHNGKTAFASDTQCARCHDGVKGYDEGVAKGKIDPNAKPSKGPKEPISIGEGDSAVKFVHASHTNKFRCAECHVKLFTVSKDKLKISMGDLYEGKFCGACHNGKKAFSANECGKCHAKMSAPKAAIVYKPQGIGQVSFSHEFHTQAFSCSECHPGVFKMKKGGVKMTMDAINAGKQCGKCHNGKVATAATECNKCHAQ